VSLDDFKIELNHNITDESLDIISLLMQNAELKKTFRLCETFVRKCGNPFPKCGEWSVGLMP